MFKSREEAGQLLARELLRYRDRSAVVLAIPRGGVVVGREVADALKAALDVVVVRKIGAPGNEELAIGAVGPGATVIWNEDLLPWLGIGRRTMERLLQEKEQEREAREKRLRGDRPMPDLTGRVIILVDDGIATGSTVAVAARWVKTQRPERMVLAVPVAPPEAVERMRGLFDEVVCLSTPEEFFAVGQFYEEFPQVSDEEVRELLGR